MGADMWAKVVQRGILVRESEGTPEALLLRNPNGTWELPGGKIEHGDAAVESLEREVEEETGLAVTDAEPVATTVRKVKKKKRRGKFAVVYRCGFEGDAVEISDEHVDFAWLDRERVGETTIKEVDEYRSLRRVLAEPDRTARQGREAVDGHGVGPTGNGEGQ
ncbi:NUDIX domain-containing protein [Salinigranum salinum]|uniref:NUDIX domain-containing protein n=1 Tax=Salinigranum salinum TaxID=1364937 RepID=UPI001260EE35|nr:NUDIX domain-containing protein [Salinigranum salinum]